MKIVIKLITVHKYKCTIHRKTLGHNSPSGSIKHTVIGIRNWLSYVGGTFYNKYISLSASVGWNVSAVVDVSFRSLAVATHSAT